jgi:hypothetical protein
MLVVTGPETYQIVPVSLLIALRTHPLILCVPRHVQRLLDLRPDESVMVVGSGIDQVAEDLLTRPFASDAGQGGVLVVNCG